MNLKASDSPKYGGERVRGVVRMVRDDSGIGKGPGSWSSTFLSALLTCLSRPGNQPLCLLPSWLTKSILLYL